MSDASRILDFGAGQGHMCQRIGKHFETLGKDPGQYLHACEVSTEQFQYSKVSCDQMGFHSEIPYPDASFDIVYAIEVLEHTQRPYHFIDEAFRALAPGGTLIFSVPNILQLNARVNFLFSGFPDFFGPPSTADKNAGRICGHVMPLGYSYFVYGLRRAGFTGIEVRQDRSKRSARILYYLMFPLLKLGTMLYQRKFKAYDSEVWNENRDVVDEVNRPLLATSRSCIMVARKPRV